MVTVTELRDVYSDDGSVMISIEVSGGVAEGERVEWTWSYPYFTLLPGQSKGFITLLRNRVFTIGMDQHFIGNSNFKI